MKSAYCLTLLAIILFLFGINGVRAAATSSTDGVNVLIRLGIQFGFAMLCLADSRVMQKRVTHAFAWLTFFLWPILVPGYLIWSRGLRGMWLALLLALLVILSTYLPFIVTCLVLYDN